jgi:hypothetical protein
MPLLEPEKYEHFRNFDDSHLRKEYYDPRILPLIARAVADAVKDFAGVADAVQLMETAYDRCMRFFHEYYDPKTNTYGMYWSGNSGWFDHRMVYLFITAYCQRYGELVAAKVAPAS